MNTIEIHKQNGHAVRVAEDADYRAYCKKHVRHFRPSKFLLMELIRQTYFGDEPVHFLRVTADDKTDSLDFEYWDDRR